MLTKTYRPLIEPLKNIYKIKEKLEDFDADKQLVAKVEKQEKEERANLKRKASAYLTKIVPKQIKIVEPQRSANLSAREEVFETEPEDDEINSSDETVAESDRTLYQTFAEDTAPEVVEEYLMQYDNLPREYLRNLIYDTEKRFDHKTGIRYNVNTDEWKIGSETVHLKGKDFKIKNKLYPGTKGLYELMFMNDPSEFTQNDLDNYREILVETNAARRHYDPAQQLRGDRSSKHILFIKPLLNNKQVSRTRSLSLTTTRYGRGASMLVTNKPYQYVYWNDINELIDRLCLLHASKGAGNTAHQNEIVAIEEELREAKVIL